MSDLNFHPLIYNKFNFLFLLLLIPLRLGILCYRLPNSIFIIHRVFLSCFLPRFFDELFIYESWRILTIFCVWMSSFFESIGTLPIYVSLGPLYLNLKTFGSYSTFVLRKGNGTGCYSIFLPYHYSCCQLKNNFLLLPVLRYLVRFYHLPLFIVNSTEVSLFYGKFWFL